MGFKRLAISLIFVAWVAAYFVAWRNFDPRRADFPSWYIAARVWQSGGSVYDLNVTCPQQTSIRGSGCLPYNRPPVLLPAIAAVSNDNYEKSYNQWTLALTLVLLSCFIPLNLLLKDTRDSLLCLLFYPLFVGVVLGQETPFIVFGVLMWISLMLCQKDFWSGLALSLAALKPQFAFAFAIPLLFSRPRAFVGCALGCLVLTIFSVALVGVEGVKGLLETTILTARSDSQNIIIGQSQMLNLTGLLTRMGLSAFWSWPMFLACLVFVGLLWKKDLGLPALGLGTVGLLFTMPHLHSHDLALMIVPVLTLSREARIAAITAFLLIFALNLEYICVYLLMMVIAYANLKSLREPSLTGMLLRPAS